MLKSGHRFTALTTTSANYDTTFDCYFLYLQAGSAPASRSSLTAVFCAAAEATCSRVNPDESMGLLRRVRGLGTSEGLLPDRSPLSAGSWRRRHRVSTSPILQAVNRASLRPYSHDSSTISTETQKAKY